MTPLGTTYGLWTVEARFLCTSAAVGPAGASAPLWQDAGGDRHVLQVRKRQRERVRGVRRGNAREAQDDTNHLSDLGLFRAATAGDDSLDQRGRVFDNGQTGARTHQQSDPARMTEFGSRLRIPRIEQRLDTGHMGRVGPHDLFERSLDGHQAHLDGRPHIRVDDAVVPMEEARSGPLDDAPSEVPRPWVDAEDDHVA